MPAIPQKVLIIVPPDHRRVFTVVGYGILCQEDGGIKEVRMYQGIGIDVDVPIVLHPAAKFVNLELFVNNRPSRELPVGDDEELSAYLLRPAGDERISDLGD